MPRRDQKILYRQKLSLLRPHWNHRPPPAQNCKRIHLLSPTYRFPFAEEGEPKVHIEFEISTQKRTLAARNAFRTSIPKPKLQEGPPNTFGLFRRYYSASFPTHDPEATITLEDLYDSVSHTDPEPPEFSSPSLGPFPNMNSFELGEWFITSGSQLSLSGLQNLVKLLQKPGFVEDVAGTKWPKVLGALGEEADSSSQDAADDEWVDDDGWKTTPVSITVPIGKRVETCTVGSLYHRNIVSIIREKITNSPDMQYFHYDPFEVLWQPDPTVPPMRVHSELYNSDAFLKAHRELQDSPPRPDCNRPRVVASLMFWSDETHLTNFSNAKLWPCYMFFGNESKYRRAKPSMNLCHHVAYFEKPSDEFKEFVTSKFGGRLPPKSFLAHCKMEMFHAQWEVLLDDELLDAIKNGIVLMCQDGIERRFYIRIFTYSADYPEKVLIATIRGLGDCPCPRCLVSKDNLDQLGTEADFQTREGQARRDDNARRELVQSALSKIFHEGISLSGKAVDDLLKPQSLQPVMSAFTKRLKSANFDIFSALTVDLLHEFELGVWKALFIHLIRILEASQKHEILVHKLDKRYRLVPTFGKTIRRFSQNASEMKRKAARDFEDLLQCAIPVFDGLLPNQKHGQAVLSILSVCARWHALAKLRMHTDVTLQLLEHTTIELGTEFRTFVSTVCNEIQTKELAIEVAARERRERNRLEKEAKAAMKEKKRREKELSGAQSQDAMPPSSTQTEDSAPPPAQSQDALPPSSTQIEDSAPLSAQAKDATPQSGASDHAQDGSGTSTLADGTRTIKATPLKRSSKSKAKVFRAKFVTLNIQTPKFHFLGDYVPMIRTFGTSDSFSTEAGEFIHRYPKRWYQRTSKRNIRKEITRQERKVARIRAMRQKINEAKKKRARDIEEQKVAAKNADIHHYIGISQNCPVSLINLSRTYPDDTPGLDPLGKSFMKGLREHLLPRLELALFDRARATRDEESGPLKQQKSLDSSHIVFKDYRIFSHKILRVKYTTYDVRRDEDVIHVDSDVCNIMIHNPAHHDNSDAHPYLYGRVLGIFHAHVSYGGEFAVGAWDLHPFRLEFLWIRWYNFQNPEPGFTSPLDRLSFPPVTSPNSTSFINPDTVLRAAHLIPRFHLGRVHEGGNGLSEMAGDGLDWREYYVNRFADRDMFMRYQTGMAVGHLPQRISKPSVSCAINRPEAPSTDVPLNVSSDSTASDRAEGEENGAEDGGGDDDDDDDDQGRMTEGEMDNEEEIEPNELDIVMYGY
ncbi:hypothetical protein H1R20_g3796, partial [Candolleomyces eurysporus]